jgi:hypothetical protein
MRIFAMFDSEPLAVQVLQAVLARYGVPEELFAPVCVVVDKVSRCYPHCGRATSAGDCSDQCAGSGKHMEGCVSALLLGRQMRAACERLSQ